VVGQFPGRQFVRGHPKKSRNKKRLKQMLKEIKGIKKTIKSAKRVKTCPHCGEPLWDEA
jgi:nucleosome binding factor SPN SPT16 subunit